ncbi:SPOR domain-containing protein [Novosphingobium sp. Gsoil 351]|uniref:SPOR domain-containing protein n=1 Tax=Novosphingobium sp. Gsoil 351 TaxID=2675225 RepID=UPI0012B484E9|nr:SPOR domain-containing protein [Novosphingobium sp. Gsoil 351]QGN55579.1 SPOR domain-containing protein [Novosphingobium sp. Gsoil 351]
MIAVSRKLRILWTASLALAAVLAGFGPARAQQDDADELDPVARAPYSNAVVQPLPSQQSYQLNAALTRLAANPRDIAALIDAGNAALALGDNDAALGFLGRADQLSPGDPRVKTALASALVKNEDPFAAIPLFDAAERAGARDGTLAGDRGLAYDLVGDNFSAQRYYRQALATAPASDEIVRRLALSQAIAGDRKGAEATLLTQLRRNDPAAWRTRAFMLAILGDTEEAVKIATGTMPRDLSAAMIPYLRYMGRLTPAQQAAAANFGHFPRAAQIGRDDPRVARYAALNPRKPPVPVAAVAAKSDAKTRKSKSDRLDRRRERVAERDPGTRGIISSPPVETRRVAAVAAGPAPAPASVPRQPVSTVRVAAATLPPPRFVQPPAYRPAPVPASAPAPALTPSPAQVSGPAMAGPSLSPAGPPSSFALSPAAGAALPIAAPTSGPSVNPPVTAAQAAASNLDLARRAQLAAVEQAPTPLPPPVAVPAISAPTVVPPPQVPPAPVPEPRRDLAAVFSDFRPPAEEQRAVEAVDLSKLPARTRKPTLADERGPIPDAPTGTRRIAAADPALSTAAKKGIDPKTGKPLKLAEKPTKPVVPSHPSRIWVQLGVGRDKSALGFDWRKLGKAQADVFKGKKPWTTPWGQTNRLLAGPFETQAAAQAFLKDVRKKDSDAFVWTSPAGQAVDALAAK